MLAFDLVEQCRRHVELAAVEPGLARLVEGAHVTRDIRGVDVVVPTAAGAGSERPGRGRDPEGGKRSGKVAHGSASWRGLGTRPSGKWGTDAGPPERSFKLLKEGRGACR